MAWLGLGEFAFNDYDNEARAATEALAHGHLGSFLALAPVYGGSLLERAPFALATGALGGGELAVYRMMALPCLLSGAALGLWLIAWMRRDGQGLLSQALALVVCVANPVTLLALEIGHPDELYGGALCVAAVLLASRRHSLWAGIALGLAIANKEWAVLAVGPVLLALPAGRVKCMALTGAVTGALLAPFAIAGGGFLTSLHSAATTAGAAGSAGTAFQPWQIWWFLGSPVHTSVGAALTGIPAGARLAPGWVEQLSHPLIVLLAVPLTAGTWLSIRRSRGSLRPEHAALLLLALLLLERFMLDPWDNVYYPLPFLLAMLAWEALALRRTALVALVAMFAVWLGHRWLGAISTPDAQAAFFAAWTVPLAFALAAKLYGAPLARRMRALRDDREILGEPGEHLAALVGDDRQILDAHAEAVG
jgi:hypothetical protein